MLASSIRRNPVKYALLALSILALTCLELWQDSSPLSPRQWNPANLKRINPGNPDHFSFAVFGDSRNSGVVFESLLKMIDHDSDIAFAVSLGNAVQTGRMSRYRWFFNQVHDYLGIPLLILMGDHERRGQGPPLYHTLVGPGHFSFCIGKSHFIVLDNSTGKGLYREQKEWLLRELKRYPKADLRIVFMHRPPHDPKEKININPQKQGSENPADLFSNHGISYVFASHFQGIYEGQWQGIPLAVTGLGGAELYGNNPEGRFPHFLKVGIDKGNVHVELKRVPSPGFGRTGNAIYGAWSYFSTFLRFYGIQALLLIAAGGSAIAICLSGTGKRERGIRGI